MIPAQQKVPLNILLAEDDNDDRSLFKKALSEIPLTTHLESVNDGEQLMKYLSKNQERLPDVLFLDLSMPFKTGFECLTEINEHPRLKDIFIVVFSTSFGLDIKYEQSMAETLCANGAHIFIRKPADFKKFKNIIYETLIKMPIPSRKRNTMHLIHVNDKKSLNN